MKLSLIIPCFNEAGTLEDTVRRLRAVRLPAGWESEIIAVDDGSKDGTPELLKALENRGDLHALYHTLNRGKGAAVKTALKEASGDYILVQDADAEYDPADIPALLDATSRADSVFGSRNMGNNNVPYNAVYFYGGLMVTNLFNLLFRTRLSDTASCYKLFPRRYIPLLLASDHDDFAFDNVVMTCVFAQSGTIVEVPVSYTARTKKEGKKLNIWHATTIVSAILLTRVGFGDARHVRSAARILRFVTTGTLAAAVNTLALFLFTDYGRIWYLYSSVLAFLIAFGFNFFLQKYWVFGSHDPHKIKHQLPLHLSAAVFNLGVNTLLLYVFVEFLSMWYVAAQLLASALIAFQSFAMFRWIFR